jgi:hypothetical protein
MTTTTSKFGGTRIPQEKIGDLPLVKSHELVTIHRDGSVRYFAQFTFTVAQEPFSDPDVIAVVYNDVQGPRQPEIVVSDAFKFDSTFLKCMFALRLVMARYVMRAFYHVSIYRTTDATVTSLGFFKLGPSAELRLRAAL